ARAEAAARAVGGGALRACPVGQPRAFSDDFGDPRSGGRRHQGNDIVAPRGTPVYAAQPGRFEQTYNDLGGISAYVYGDSGDTTYYAHLDSYAGVPNGSHVPAGTMIGHVGNTGNARGGVYHLHFEYHPGGGGAVNPYRLLRAVCG
ncbi:MAG: M23 family metallopeptidase, partial [Actinomycetota bacterium]